MTGTPGTTSIERLRNAVLETAGESAPLLRRAVEARAAKLAGAVRAASGEIPAPVAAYADKVALHAYKVTGDDIDALRRAGYPEDAIFEITLSAALGAGLARLERGLAALQGGA